MRIAVVRNRQGSPRDRPARDSAGRWQAIMTTFDPVAFAFALVIVVIFEYRRSRRRR